MAVIQFTDADVMQTVTVENGIYPTVITKVEGPKASGSGKSTAIYYSFQIAVGKYKGKVKTIAFSTGVRDTFAPGDMQMEPNAKILVVDQAITGNTPEPKTLDTDNHIGKSLKTQWIIVTEDGKLYNQIIGFFNNSYEGAPGF